MDRIFIQGLRTQAVIGMYDWEKQFKQPLIFDIEIETDLRTSSASDAIEDTIDYKVISDKIINWVENNQFELIEPLAEMICQQLLTQHPSAERIHLTCHKPNAVIDAESVGIRISRGRD